MRSIALLIALAAALGCPVPPPSPTMKVSSGDDATALARALLDAVKRNDIAAATRTLCTADRARVDALGRVGAYRLDHVEPAWVGAEPYFRVDVTLDQAGGDERRSLAIRARDGCIERTGGTPIGPAAPPEPGELSL